jgi:hypothetical protein
MDNVDEIVALLRKAAVKRRALSKPPWAARNASVCRPPIPAEWRPTSVSH